MAPSPSPSATSSSAVSTSSSPPFPFLLIAGNSIQSLTSNLLSRLPFSSNNPKPVRSPSCSPSSCSVTVPFALPVSSFSTIPQSPARSVSSGVRIEGLSSASSKGGGNGGPAFVGQVFTMLDPSGNGLMAVTRHLNIPFLTERTPQWLKKILANVTKSDMNGPVFRFFMDLTDAVSYVKELNVPAGMVGACRLDVAYEHFREKPYMFQFVPNEKQVKAAKKLLKVIPQKGGKRKLDGVPVFTAQNLNIAIATNDGIRWYTPYFFDKSLLDNILEASIDQHFHTMIQNRHVHRRRDVIDDSLTAEIVEESSDSLFEPPEVQELMDEMGHSGIPLSVISKAAEIELLDVVDKVILGNKWLRKATGIQPKFPYLVDSFEECTAASFNKTATSTSNSSDSDNTEIANCPQDGPQLHGPAIKSDGNPPTDCSNVMSHTGFQFPFSDWIPHLWPGPNSKQQERKSDNNSRTSEVASNPLLPKITMVGISMGEGSGQMSKASLKKTMEDLTKELEQSSHKQERLNNNEDKDPLFVANVGDYSRITRISSP